MKRELLIGSKADVATERTVLDADTLTTHGVIVGMTGSGKTGLAVVILEELARQRVPLLICDLKGDLTNLLLTFPELRPEDFAPWVPAAQVQGDRTAAAAAVAARWREGLAPWGIGRTEIDQLRRAVEWRLLTPGSALAPVNLLPALEAPSEWDPDTDPDSARSRLDGTAAGLLALVGRGGDPLTDRDHVLLSTLLDNTWRQTQALDFGALIRQIAEPPVARFGVLDAETFYPAKERQQLVMAFNTVLASPSFAVWTRGTPLAVEELIGKVASPRATILYLAHLGEREKLSFLTLLFSALLAWTRRQSGSENLRTLLYLDEVQGIIPPSAVPPTKPPLLTLLKQGRAFGTGVLLATQNPVDLDYKALGNAGVKLVGRLDTENDRQHALQGFDLGESSLHTTVANLKPRQFVLAGARLGSVRVIASRWAVSYLRGPLTLAELKPLLSEAPGPAASAPTPPAQPSAPLLPGVEQFFGTGARLYPAVLVEAEVIYRKGSPAIERRVAGSWAVPLESGRIAWERLRRSRGLELVSSPPVGVSLAALPGNAGELLRGAGREFTQEVDSVSLEVCWHRDLRLVQEDGEDQQEFARRCEQAAPAGSGKEAELRRRYEGKIRKVRERLAKEKVELEHDEEQATARQREKTLTVATGVGEALLGALFGRSRGLGSLARRGASTARSYSTKERMAERAKASVEESQHTIAQLDEELQRLEQELADQLAALQVRPGGGSEIEVLRLTPTQKDISVRRVALAWLPEDSLP